MFASLIRSAAIMLAGLAIAALPTVHAAAFDTVDPPQPSDTQGKVEVLEFFSYSCPHCNAIEPMVEKWRANLPDGAVFKGVPVAFNAGMRSQQKLYFVLEALGRLDLHPLVFRAIHDEHKDLYEEDEITDWAAAQGLDRKEFTDVFNSFGIQAKATRANELVKAYGIDGTPSFGVGGRYVTSPSHVGGYQAAVDEADKLLKQILAGN